MEYLDEGGYLYVTGRSKEVVNRGGELISPFEVEAIMIAASRPESQVYGRVKEAVVFSATHEVLQETLGVVLVTPVDKPRPDIRQLHEALRSSLHQIQWPMVVAYMSALPTRNVKVHRIRLSEHFGMLARGFQDCFARSIYVRVGENYHDGMPEFSLSLKDKVML